MKRAGSSQKSIDAFLSGQDEDTVSAFLERKKPAFGSTMNNKRLSITIRGRVQGVGYRLFAQEAAEALGVTGWVRNGWNSEVEVEAQSDEPTLRLYCDRLREGPVLSRVADLDMHEIQTVTDESGFEVRT
jgi:acylphosphatase